MSTRLAALLLAVCVAGCETLPQPQTRDVAERDRFVERQASLVRQHESRGALGDAVLAQQVIVSVHPTPEHKAELNRLAGARERRVRQLEAQAQKAGSVQEKRLAYLKVLALDGRHAAARAYLRRQNRAQALEAQQAKDDAKRTASAKETTEDPAPAVKEKQDFGPLYQRIGEWLKGGQIKEAFVAYASAPEAAQSTTVPQISALADASYRKGRELMRRDLGDAIIWFQRALQIDPGHREARSALSQAERMQQNLNRIQSR